MAVIAETDSRGAIGAIALTLTTLGASDTLPYDATKRQALLLQNTSGSSMTVTIDGADGTNVPIDGIGNVTVSAGLNVVVPAGEVRLIVLPTIRHYLQGVVTTSGASGMRAAVITL
jgi:hypothetical protein